MIDLSALHALSVSSVSRTALSAHWISITASNALQNHGYKVRIWALPGVWRLLYEYLDEYEQIRGRSKLGRGHRNQVDRAVGEKHAARIGSGLPYRPIGPVHLPRVTAHTYRRQVAIHRSLGLSIVPRVAPWVDHGQSGLFDQVLGEEAMA